MNAESNQSGIRLPIPCPETRLFRYAATRTVVNLLSDNPHAQFTIRELHRATDHSFDNVRNAVSALEEVGLVTVTPDGNRNLVAIDRARLSKPSDPITSIPQPEFHRPVKEGVDRLRSELDDVRGIVLFGSVAKGTADRRSDVDLFVLVEDRQASNQQAAHEVANELGTERFDGDRYRFQVLVESVETARHYGDRLRDVFTNCISVVETEALQDLKREVLTDGR